MQQAHKQKNLPLVSIITPSLNSAKFLEECIQSVLAQDYPKVEHIIQDGGSKDQTLKILEKYSSPPHDRIIKWISRPDDGPVDASNRALKRCSGDIILFFGADCILMPQACTWSVENMNKYKDVAVIYGNEYIIDEKSRTIKTFIPGPYNFAKLVYNELIPPTEASFIRRSAFEKVGFYLKEASDYDLWIRLGLKFPLKHITGFVSKFRWHPDSRSRSPRLIEQFITNKKEVMDKLFESPQTPAKIKSLKKRAYIGLYFWGASMALDSGAKYEAIKYLTQSLLTSPSDKKFDDYVSYWKQAVRQDNRVDQPLVSIVTPSYNAGRFIEECIQSVLAQDYPHIEHIIQDGNSTDDTKTILARYQKPQYRQSIRIFSESDHGQSDALNRAIQKTKGEIILVLNADDLLMPYVVSWGVENMKAYPKAGVVYGDAYIINEKGEIIDIYKSDDYDFEKLLCVELVPPAQAAFIRRSALEAVGFWADSTLDTCPDYEMWIRLAKKFPMKHAFGVITKYRHYRNPPLDSKKPRLTQRFVAAKREVMDRFFKSPKVSLKYKKLRRRAYASLDLWASQVAFEIRQPKEGVYYLLRSFLRRPTLTTFVRIVQTSKMLAKFLILRAFK